MFQWENKVRTLCFLSLPEYLIDCPLKAMARGHRATDFGAAGARHHLTPEALPPARSRIARPLWRAARVVECKVFLVVEHYELTIAAFTS